MQDLDWQKIDNDYKYSYREDRLKVANNMGYNYISECTAKLYEKHQSTNKVSQLIGISAAGVTQELRKIGIKLRSRGGNQSAKKGRHHWNPLMSNTRAPFSRAE
jgi:hypothetical protein